MNFLHSAIPGNWASFATTWLVHVTLLAAVACLAYAVLRRFGPAVGATSAVAALAAVAFGSVLLLMPLPRWWSVAAPTNWRQWLPGELISQSKPLEIAATPTSGANSFDPVSANDAPSPIWQSAESVPSPQPLPVASSRSTWPIALFAVMAALVGFGCLRLLLGLRILRALQRVSRPIVDAQLDDEVAILMAKLSLTTAVQLRECPKIGAPATIGWRRSTLLLPMDWKSWSATERTVVLAHELAHIKRRDYLAGLFGQLCQAFYFFHPLVHWLTRQLRLDQELAADAWAAQLSGGRQTYLLTLANFALRLDDRAVPEPARGFLPYRGLFVRRLAMLRDPKLCRHRTPTLVARWGIALSFLALSVVAAGYGSLNAQGLGAGSSPTSTGPINWSGVPTDAFGVLVFRPASAIADKNLAALAEFALEIVQRTGAAAKPYERLDQVAYFPPLNSGGPLGIVMRTTEPYDFMQMDKATFGNLKQSEIGGRKVLTPERSNEPGLMILGDRQAVVGTTAAMERSSQALGANLNSFAWSALLKGKDNALVTAALDMSKFRTMLDTEAAVPGSSGTRQLGFIKGLIGPVFDKAQAATVTVEVNADLRLDAAASFSSPADAIQAVATVNALAVLGKNQISALRASIVNVPANDREPARLALDICERLLDHLKVEVVGNDARLTTGIATEPAIRVLLPALKQMVAGASRTNAANNLKQIAIAMHNYHSTYNRFPAAQWRGPDGNAKHPHSWRVALLPYLEQDALFRQYRFDEPWDSPANRAVMKKMPAVYRNNSPTGATGEAAYHSAVFALVGPGTIWEVNDGCRLADITDGTSNTIMVVETARPIPWNKPEDIEYAPDQPLPKFSNIHRGIFQAALCDGSVRAIADSIDQSTLRALITRNGGEVINR